jgi:hypothetical protein
MDSGLISASVVSKSVSSVWVDASTTCHSRAYTQLGIIYTDTVVWFYLPGVVCSCVFNTRTNWDDFASAKDFVQKERFRIRWCDEINLRLLDPGAS